MLNDSAESPTFNKSPRQSISKDSLPEDQEEDYSEEDLDENTPHLRTHKLKNNVKEKNQKDGFKNIGSKSELDKTMSAMGTSFRSPSNRRKQLQRANGSPESSNDLS